MTGYKHYKGYKGFRFANTTLSYLHTAQQPITVEFKTIRDFQTMGDEEKAASFG